MRRHDFSALLDHYPAVIAQMPATFTSHQFILKLAHDYQGLYVEALGAYCNASRQDEQPAPFWKVHSILAKKLYNFPDIVELVRRDAPSPNIFGALSSCAEWRRHAAL